MKQMKIIKLCCMALLLAAVPAAGCEFTYRITDSLGFSREVSPDEPISLTAGESYVLELSYWEDHRSCPLGPEGTVVLLEGGRWIAQRQTQPLVLQDPVSWPESSSRTKTGYASFIPQHQGTWTLEILRICTRDGYRGSLQFVVMK